MYHSTQEKTLEITNTGVDPREPFIVEERDPLCIYIFTGNSQVPVLTKETRHVFLPLDERVSGYV